MYFSDFLLNDYWSQEPPTVCPVHHRSDCLWDGDISCILFFRLNNPGLILLILVLLKDDGWLTKGTL